MIEPHPIIQAVTLRECRHCGALVDSVYGKSIRTVVYRCGTQVAWDRGEPLRMVGTHGGGK